MKNIIGILIICSSLAHANAHGNQLTATIVGSGSPVFNVERASASVLISNGSTQILVDMGNGTQANLNSLGVKINDLSALLFTHHHVDHNEEFVPIFIRALLGRGTFHIVGPPNTSKLAQINLEFYKEDIAYRLDKTGRTIADRKNAFEVMDIKGGESFIIDDIKISTVKVNHTIHTIAYRFDYNGSSIVITGDLTYTEELPKLAKNADLMIIDSGGMIMDSAMRRSRNINRNRNLNRVKRERAHLNLHESSLMAKEANVKTMVYTHFTPGKVDEEKSLEEIRKNFNGKVILGIDLLEVKTLNNSSQVDLTKLKNNYPIVDTRQEHFYDNHSEISKLDKGDDFYGQDASYLKNIPSYTDNKDGTITDNVTGLMWQKDFEVLSYNKAVDYASKSTLGGYPDWRLPSIKEMYSLILFDGVDASSRNMYSVPLGAKPFIDTEYFTFKYGANGNRMIDVQFVTTNIYTGTTMRNDKTIFGVNMADGRIKGYPMVHPRTGMNNKFSVRLVRGNPVYGNNNFVDNGDNTVSDLATGLMWSKDDSQKAMNWKDALAWVQLKNKEKFLGYSDWKLPNAKELHSIIDYSRSPQATNSAAINPIFNISTIKDEQGKDNFPFFLTSTTHLNTRGGSAAVYLCFGKALGSMKTPRSESTELMDVHGAGAQRSDPKTGKATDYPEGHGPQGDVVRIEHYVRLVREMGP